MIKRTTGEGRFIKHQRCWGECMMQSHESHETNEETDRQKIETKRKTTYQAVHIRSDEISI
jgi:hypothetical protein